MPGWGNRKPPFGTPIDWSHPLSRGLVAAWPLNEGGGTRCRDAVSGLILTLAGSAAWTDGPRGRCLATAGVGALASVVTPARLKLNPPLTIVWQGRSTGTRNAFASLFGVEYAQPHTSPYIGYHLSSTTSGNVDFFYNRAGSTSLNHVNAADAAPALATGVTTQLAGVIRHDGANTSFQSRLFRNGIDLYNNQDWVGVTTINYDATSIVAFGDDSGGPATNITSDYGWIYGIGLPNSLLLWLATEPFEMFEYPTRRQYAATLATGPHRLAGIGGGLAGPYAHLTGNK